MLTRANAAGQELTFAPLSEVADLCVEGIREGWLWVCQPGAGEKSLARARSQSDRAVPEYLVQEPNIMTGRKAGARD